MKAIFLILGLSCLPLIAHSQEEAVDGLGKVERIERLETIVTSLQGEIAKLKASLNNPGESEGAKATNFVRHTDLLTLKNELVLNAEREIKEVKVAAARAQQRIENLDGQINQLKEGTLKDLTFKLDVLQKSFEALEQSTVKE